ncbi:MAG TPA: DUF1835 domain-containing protein [Longimicrobiaceae bacterium]|nr:DUF1835 domain-containing protein [Longimicrobiaceae bacterium]
MLHITNGDTAAGVLRLAGVPGPVLPWRDVLHEGPVPAGLPLEALSAVRARFIAEGWAPEDEVLRSFAERDAALRGFRDHAEVVLWFEHDLYDQLQLIQVLDWLAGEERGATRLSLVCRAEYLGSARPARLAELFETRAEVSDAQLALARAAWEAFRAPDPTAVEALAAGDTSALPFLGAALVRHLEQFPSLHNGLSRSEQQAVSGLRSGSREVGELYTGTHHGMEEPVWLGDSTFACYLEGLSGGEQPLVLFDDGSPVEAPRNGDGQAFYARRVTLTEAGRAVEAGWADRVRLNGIDRWLGGVHLRGRDLPWRWDAGRRALARGESSPAGRE